MVEAPPHFMRSSVPGSGEVTSPRACLGQERGADTSPLDTVKELQLYLIPCVAFLVPKTEQA